MLQIRLNKDSSAEGGGGPRPLPVESVTVACPDHLVLADLPVAKSLGVVTAASIVKNVGRKSRRQLGERVHFCVRCDLPIAIYGRLSPCEHAFCLDCARSDSICYLCDERIQKIQTIKMMEGLFICAAPHCLKSFLKKADFESHIHEYHAKLIQPNVEKEEGNESEAVSAKQSTASESTLRAPSRPGFSPSSNSQLLDREDKSRRQQPREQPPSRPFLQPKPPFFGQVPNHPSEPQFDNSRPPGFESGFESSVPQNHFHQQGFNTQSGMQQETAHFSDKQQGNLSENSYPEYAMHPHQPPNFTPVNSNPVLPPPFSYPPFPSEGAQPFYNASYEVPRQDSAPEVGSEQGSLLGFPPGQAVGMNFQAAYPQPWSTGPTGVPFEPPPGSQGTAADAFMNMSDPNGRASFFHGDYGRNSGGLPLNAPPPHLANKTLEPMQGGNSMDPRDGKGILAPQPLPVLPPPASHMAQHNRGNFYAGDMAHDGQGFGWQQHEKRDNFGSGQDS